MKKIRYFTLKKYLSIVFLIFTVASIQLQMQSYKSQMLINYHGMKDLEWAIKKQPMESYYFH